MTSMRRAIDEAADTLTAAGIDTARVDAEHLAAHAAGVDRGRLTWHEPDDGFFERYHELVAARAGRIPLQHLTTTAAFGPVTLAVGPGVFIPRPETEALLEWALAIALADARPGARVVAVDDSAEALAYARRNSAGTGVDVREANVTDRHVLDDLVGEVDLVVANPPYIPDGAVLEPEVAEHDPAHALFGGPDGMQVIGPIVALSARLLRPGGLAAVEHDDTTADQTVAMFTETGAFSEVTARRDLTGRPRFVTARRGMKGEP